MIKKDRREELSLTVDHLNNKKDIRAFLLQTWSDEEEGIQFRYTLETLSNNKKIYLERPTNLNKGSDFVIKVEDMIVYKNGNDKPPKHESLLDYIKNKKQVLQADEYKKLIDDIKNVYDCKTIKVNYIDNEHEIILKLCKWFFIEQDITYWANSGRAMLWGAIQKTLQQKTA